MMVSGNCRCLNIVKNNFYNSVSVGRQPTRVVPVKATVLEEDELAALQAELAL